MTFFSYAWDWITQPAQWHGADGIPHQVLTSLGYAGLSLLIASLIAIPAGIAIGHTGRGATFVVNLANASRAIPTLGLLTLLVVLVGFASLTWLVPLVVLAIPPILINAYEGVAAVDPQVKQAAVGLGMTGWQQVTPGRGAGRHAADPARPADRSDLRGNHHHDRRLHRPGRLGRYIIDGLASNQYGPVAGGALLVVILAVLVLAFFAGLSRLVIPAGLRNQDRTP